MPRIPFLLFLFLPLFSLAQLTVVELEVKKIPEPVSRDSAVDAWNITQPGYRQLPQRSKELLYWTNLARHNPKYFWDSVLVPLLRAFPKLNKTEAKSLELDLKRAGQLPMFSLNTILIRTAQAHATDIGSKKATLGHNSSTGVDFGTRMRLAGIRRCANENIALSSQNVLLSVALLYLDINLPALSHRKTLLDPNLREIGVGSALYGQDQYFLVQDFACAQ